MSTAIYMLNALWFKPEGGQEKYMEYGAAIAPLLQKYEAQVLENYQPEESLIGDWDPDLFFLVKYPSKQAFEAMISSHDYREIAHLREEALVKSLLVRCAPFAAD